MASIQIIFLGVNNEGMKGSLVRVTLTSVGVWSYASGEFLKFTCKSAHFGAFYRLL